MLDARIASALDKIIQNSYKKILRGRQIAHMIDDYFRVTGAHDTVVDYADPFTISLRDDVFSHSENSAKITDIHMSGPLARTTHQRWQTNKVQHDELRTNRCPWFIDKLLKLNYTYISNISIAESRASRINKK